MATREDLLVSPTGHDSSDTEPWTWSPLRALVELASEFTTKDGYLTQHQFSTSIPYVSRRTHIGRIPPHEGSEESRMAFDEHPPSLGILITPRPRSPDTRSKAHGANPQPSIRHRRSHVPDPNQRKRGYPLLPGLCLPHNPRRSDNEPRRPVSMAANAESISDPTPHLAQPRLQRKPRVNPLRTVHPSLHNHEGLCQWAPYKHHETDLPDPLLSSPRTHGFQISSSRPPPPHTPTPHPYSRGPTTILSHLLDARTRGTEILTINENIGERSN